MKLNDHKTVQFYQKLGKLFYAMAAVDGVVRAEEFDAVEELVKKYWLQKDFTSDKAKTDAKNAIIDTFKALYEDKANAEACYKSFISFKKQNESIFTSQMNSLILKTTGKIAASFSGQNKSELMMLANLSIELKKGGG